MDEPTDLPPHPYESTACQHELHDRCRRSCKFCGSGCSCACHATREDYLAAPVS